MWDFKVLLKDVAEVRVNPRHEWEVQYTKNKLVTKILF